MAHDELRIKKCLVNYSYSLILGCGQVTFSQVFMVCTLKWCVCCCDIFVSITDICKGLDCWVRWCVDGSGEAWRERSFGDAATLSLRRKLQNSYHT